MCWVGWVIMCSKLFFDKSEKILTCSLLNPVALAADVPVGGRTNQRKSPLVPCWILWLWQRMFLLVDVQIKENHHLFLAESCGSGSGCSCWWTYKSKKIPTCSLLNSMAVAADVPVCWRNDSLSLCHFIKRLNQSLPAASLATENGLGILFWKANWKASLLTSSRVYLKYFQSITKIYSTCFFSRAGGTTGLRPPFWLGGLKRVRIWANVIA